MEFVQFFPLALAEPGHPPRLVGAGIVEDGHIVNKHGEDIRARVKSTRQEFDAVQAETELERYRNLRSMEGNVKPRDLIDELRELMWVKASMVRTHEGLNDALENVHKLRNKMDKLRVDKPRDILEALEVPMTLDVAEMIIRSALERTESRGAHFRVDYPELDENWVKTVVLHREKGCMTVGTRSLGNSDE